MTTKRDQLHDLSLDMLKCRTSVFRHAWEDFTSSRRLSEWEIRPDLALRCTRCATEKYLWMDAAGNYSYPPHYIYPEGYKLIGTYQGDRLGAAELRAELMRRGVHKRRLHVAS